MGQKALVKVVEVHTKRHIPLERKTCPQCGKMFAGAKVARYCPRACVMKASYQRHAEERRKKRRQTYAKMRGKV